jgi:D,D-heptose 1,7-bisphosphate phosphatase
MEAVILAGGYGTRLEHIVPDIPKSMAPVAGRPFLRYILDDMAESDIEKVVLAVGYRQEKIVNYFGNNYRGIDLVYSLEDEPLLTGGAVKKALTLCENKYVFVVNGDTYLEFDYANAAQVRDMHDAEVLIAVKHMQDTSRYGTVLLENNHTLPISNSAEAPTDSLVAHIIGFEEKVAEQPAQQVNQLALSTQLAIAKTGYINAGVYYLRQDSLTSLPNRFSLETDYFPEMIIRTDIMALLADGLFIDIGVPNDYEYAQQLLSPKAHQDNRLAFFDRDGTINVDIGHLFEPEKMVLIERTIDLIRKHREEGYRIIVVTNQGGIAKGLYTLEDMQAFHRFMKSELAKLNARVDAFYYCPHHPDFGGSCICRKPEPGMLHKAIFDYEADSSAAILYGDKETDFQAAKAAGIKECHLVVS